MLENRTSHEVAVITGASSGIGEAFARRLGSQGYGLVLVARREKRLQALAGELESRCSIAAKVLPADLSRDRDVAEVERWIGESSEISMLVNNAGFGTHGRFAEVGIDKSVDMIHVHVVASTRLAKAVLPQMMERNRGVIINVSTLVADIPAPRRVVYAATKSYLKSFSRSLQVEMQEQGLQIKIRAILPGLTDTEFFSTEEYGSRGIGEEWQTYVRPPAEVVKAALDSLETDEVVVLPDSGNRRIYDMMVKRGKTWEEAARIVFGEKP